MDKVQILTEELEKVGIKYLGLDFGQRNALLRAMDRYGGPDMPLTQRFNKRFGTKNANTGLEMVVRERIEMIEKHGKTVDFDIRYNSNGELKQGAIACLSKQADFPTHWNQANCRHIRDNKIEIDRLAVAAAFCVAEIDRILNM